ncbi:hypothetical protein AMS68_004992 [Peltaster fructicola]|uniref:Glycosyl transferase family 1 domain-containing protein n=1 Tax=Peltaster fructicola TaxID=286661 RepID=A0A6H0XXU1_9PEZI|nr:hypothetical protein AMS68_004992 [Peltaster fructicola]
MSQSPSPIPTLSPGFPEELVGKKILLASESLGPVNGVSRTTQSLLDYLRKNGVNVATCAPLYVGQPININETKSERPPIVNKDWVRAIEAKSASLGSRALGGAWQWHHERSGQDDKAQQTLQAPAQPKNPPMINRSRSEDFKRKLEASKLSRMNPEFRLQGYALPYNPDLAVAYPFRLGVVYQKTFKPDLIYLASPASVGFQFLVQLMQLDHPVPTLLNFQTDLSHYATILFPAPLDRYAVFLLGMVQGFLFNAAAVHTIFYPSAYVRKYMVGTGAPAEKMLQLGRGVDTELFNPGRREEDWRKEIAPNGEVIFCCISRIAPEKGFEFLAQAALKLKETGLAFKLLIVGGNKNPVVENEVKNYFKDLPDEVIFTGMLRGVALARAYAAADVFLHCSITETFGLVVLESMASGVPVIARDEGGPSETVQHGKSGYLVDPHDLDKFVFYARMLAGHSTLRGEMAERARQQALDTTWDKINNKVALRLAAALHAGGVKSDAIKAREGYYGTWNNMVRVYGAVGIIWIFWVIAVIPMLACGLVHGMYQRRKLN